MKRVCNFSPGPAALPMEVIRAAADEFLDYHGTGRSIVETSHRSAEYSEINEATQSLTKQLLGISDDYHVLLLAGGASLQFAMIPMSLRAPEQVADYIVTGSWAKKALKEAQALGQTNIAADMGPDGFKRVPNAAECKFTPNAAYVHLTSNNTITGTQFHEFPQTEAPLVADMSSDIMSRPVDVSQFALIYAGAQKNLGPAGTTMVIIRKDMIERSRTAAAPSMLRYAVHADANSLYNTPPCFAVYMVKKTLEWVLAQGGLPAMAKRNQAKADKLYGVIDENPDFFRCPVESGSRSQMNVVFRLPDEELEKKFVATAAQQQLQALKGHRSVGGIRVSTYNGVDPAWVDTLAQFMREFIRTEG